MRRRDKDRKRLLAFLLISVLLHAAIVWLVSRFVEPAALEERPKIIEIVRIEQPPAEPVPLPVLKTRPEPPPEPEARSEPPPEPEEEKEPPTPPPTIDRDLAEIPRPEVEEEPEDAKLLAEYSRKAEKDTRLKDRPIDTRQVAEGVQEQQPFPSPRARAGKEGETQERTARLGGERLGEQVSEPRPSEEREERPEPLADEGIFVRSSERAEEPGSLLLSEERLAKYAEPEEGGIAGTLPTFNPNLFHEDLKIKFSTLAMVNAGYYIAVKKRIAQNWDPERKIRAAFFALREAEQFRRSGAILTRDTEWLVEEAIRITGRGVAIISFTILPEGSSPEEPVLISSSGSAFLDREALKAVRLAPPFPPLPKNIRTDKLTLTVRFIYGEIG